jgi:quercetin dioxygenase-like cupin family protein
MIAARLGNIELLEASSESDPTAGARLGFPISTVDGSQTCTVVLFHIEPGKRAPMHRDSADEVALVLEGQGELTLGDETVPIETGDVALLTRMTPHSVKNTGDKTLRLVTFLPAATVTTVFEQPIMPFGQRIIGTPDLLVAAGIIPAPEGVPA